jgi:hypothetical protein
VIKRDFRKGRKEEERYNKGGKYSEEKGKEEGGIKKNTKKRNKEVENN